LSIWDVLGVSPTNDVRQVKRAYSRMLKKHKPEQDPEGYQCLREAFDLAMAYCADHPGDLPEIVPVSVSEDENDFPCDHEVVPPIEDNCLDETAIILTDEEVDQLLASTCKEYDLADLSERDEPVEATRDMDEMPVEIRQQLVKFHQLVFACDDSNQAVQTFKEVILSDTLLNLCYRKIFDSQCFYSAVTWPEDQPFPGQLVEYIAEEFDWSAVNAGDDYFRDNIDYVYARMNTSLAYHALCELAKRRAFFSKQSETIRAARVLLGKHRPIYFHYMSFLSRYSESIHAIINQFTVYGELSICPELDTKTFRWWMRWQQRRPLKAIHLFVSVWVALMVVVAINEEMALELSDSALSMAFAVVTMTIFLAIWLVPRLFGRER
jgi:hypothetical protein